MADKSSNIKTEIPKDKRLTIEIVRQMLTLATSGFGLVAALAWNSLIQEFVNNYIKKKLPAESGLTSLAIYAILITIIAVIVTLQLSKLLKRLEEAENEPTEKLIRQRLIALTKTLNKPSEDNTPPKKA